MSQATSPAASSPDTATTAWDTLSTAHADLSAAVSSTLATLSAKRDSQSLRRRLASIVNWCPRFENDTGTLQYEYNRAQGTITTITYDTADVTLRFTDDGVTVEDHVRLSDRADHFHDVLDTIDNHWQSTLDEPLPNKYHGRLSDAITGYEQALDDIRANVSVDDLKHAVRKQDADLLTFLLGEEDHISTQSNTEAAGLVERPLDRVLDTQSYVIAVPEADETADEEDDPFGNTRTRRRRRQTREEDTDTREAFVLGCDDTPTGTFLHAVDATNMTTRTRVEYSDQHIRDAMGFENDADHDYDDFASEYTSGNSHAPIRVQGDLAFDKRTTYADTEAAIDATLFASLLFDQLIGGTRWGDSTARMREFLNTVDVYHTGSVIPEVDINPSFFAYANDELGLEMAARLGRQSWGTRARDWNGGQVDPRAVLPDPRHFLDPMLGTLRTRQLETEMEKTLTNIFRTKLGEFDPDTLDDVAQLELCYSVDHPDVQIPVEPLAEAYDHVRDTYGGQLNLPIDNHLLLFENAWVYPLSSRESEPVLVVVPEESTVSILHDEHDTKTFPLDAGLYQFKLLDRGLAPVDDMRPDW